MPLKRNGQLVIDKFWPGKGRLLNCKDNNKKEENPSSIQKARKDELAGRAFGNAQRANHLAGDKEESEKRILSVTQKKF